jgi:maleylpyruvate isomerase
MMRLYSFFRSSAAYRVRIALELKGLAYEIVPIHLLREGGEQLRPDYLARNPQGLVPALEVDGRVLTQSLAIIEYLEETVPNPALLPDDPFARAKVRAIALAIACEIHPLNNLKVRTYLRDELKAPEPARTAWYRHWVETGLRAIETMVAGPGPAPRFCLGGAPTVADVCLVPQVANARRFGCDLSLCPTLVAIDAACRALPAFARAAPENQPDAE